MIITQSQVALSSSHQSQRTHEQQESLQLYRTDAGGQQAVAIAADGVSLSARARELSRQVERQDPHLDGLFSTGAERPADAPLSASITPPSAPASPSAPDADTPVAVTLDGKLLMIKAIVEQISGKPVRLFDANALAASPAASPDPPATASDAPGSAEPAKPAFGLRYQRTDDDREVELTRFDARARVETADGRVLDLKLSLTLSRRFAEQHRQTLEAGVQLKDPLVVNLDGRGVRLGETLDFDLDADGRRESIAFVDGNSALLALDRNGDGRINDGSELFGARSGDGFAELAAFDEDGNGFIDAGDPVYAQLRLWVRDDGGERLEGLAERGIGALYLDAADTPFDLRDGQNRLQGRIRASGVYLTEAGGGGALQQIDLVT